MTTLRHIFLGLWLAALPVTAETSGGVAPDHGQLPLAAYVPAWVLTNPATATTSQRSALRLDEADTWRATTQSSRAFAEARRWEDFETEYGIDQPNDSTVLAQIEIAKYQLDRTVFAVDEIVQTIESALEFEYEFGRGGTRSGRINDRDLLAPSRSLTGSPRLRSDIDLNVGSARAFVGMRLVVPFGD